MVIVVIRLRKTQTKKKNTEQNLTRDKDGNVWGTTRNEKIVQENYAKGQNPDAIGYQRTQAENHDYMLKQANVRRMALDPSAPQITDYDVAVKYMGGSPLEY